VQYFLPYSIIEPSTLVVCVAAVSQIVTTSVQLTSQELHTMAISGRQALILKTRETKAAFLAFQNAEQIRDLVVYSKNDPTKKAGSWTIPRCLVPLQVGQLAT